MKANNGGGESKRYLEEPQNTKRVAIASQNDMRPTEKSVKRCRVFDADVLFAKALPKWVMCRCRATQQ